MFMHCGILAKVCSFLLSQLQISATRVSKPSLLFKLIPNSYLLLLFLMNSLSILRRVKSSLIEKGWSVLKMRWKLSAFSRNCLKTIEKVLFLLVLVFLEWRQHSEHTCRVLSSEKLIISAFSANKIKPQRNRIALLKLILEIHPDMS